MAELGGLEKANFKANFRVNVVSKSSNDNEVWVDLRTVQEGIDDCHCGWVSGMFCGKCLRALVASGVRFDLGEMYASDQGAQEVYHCLRCGVKVAG